MLSLINNYYQWQLQVHGINTKGSIWILFWKIKLTQLYSAQQIIAVWYWEKPTHNQQSLALGLSHATITTYELF